MAAVAEEAAVAAMQAFSAEQPLPQQPMPVFPGYNSRVRSLEEQQEHARLHLNDPRSLEEMRAGMKRVNDQYSREKRQAAAALCWASAVRLSEPDVAAAAACGCRAPSATLAPIVAVQGHRTPLPRTV